MTRTVKTAVIILGKAVQVVCRQKPLLDGKLSKTESVVSLWDPMIYLWDHCSKGRLEVHKELKGG